MRREVPNVVSYHISCEFFDNGLYFDSWHTQNSFLGLPATMLHLIQNLQDI